MNLRPWDVFLKECCVIHVCLASLVFLFLWAQAIILWSFIHWVRWLLLTLLLVFVHAALEQFLMFWRHPQVVSFCTLNRIDLQRGLFGCLVFSIDSLVSQDLIQTHNLNLMGIYFISLVSHDKLFSLSETAHPMLLQNKRNSLVFIRASWLKQAKVLFRSGASGELYSVIAWPLACAVQSLLIVWRPFWADILRIKDRTFMASCVEFTQSFCLSPRLLLLRLVLFLEHFAQLDCVAIENQYYKDHR